MVNKRQKTHNDLLDEQRQVTLSNHRIIELMYLVRAIVCDCKGKKIVCLEEIHNIEGSFWACQKLAKSLSPEMETAQGGHHKKVIDFFRNNKLRNFYDKVLDFGPDAEKRYKEYQEKHKHLSNVKDAEEWLKKLQGKAQKELEHREPAEEETVMEICQKFVPPWETDDFPF
jgi:hypothetical protein